MSNIVSPLLVPSDVKEFAEQNVKRALEIGALKLKINVPFDGVQFFKKSKVAGYVKPFDNSIVYLNLELLKANIQAFANDTIPHEVAHILAMKYIVKRNLPAESHHGKTWKMIMKKVYGLEPLRCHYMNTDGIGKKVKKFKYICACSKHEIGVVRHNKIEKNKRAYKCLKCFSTLTFLSECD